MVFKEVNCQALLAPAASSTPSRWRPPSIALSNAGTKRRTSRVANARPKLIETAIGIRNCACSEVSNNNGLKPAMVVKVVMSTGMTRRRAAYTVACNGRIPDSMR